MMPAGRLTINVDGMINWLKVDKKTLRKEFESISNDILNEGIKIMREEVPHGKTHELESSVQGNIERTKAGGIIRIFADAPHASILDGDDRTSKHEITPKGKSVLKFEGVSARQQIFREATGKGSIVSSYKPRVRIKLNEGGIIRVLYEHSFKIRPSEARRAAMETPIREAKLPRRVAGVFYPLPKGRGVIHIQRGLEKSQGKAYVESTKRHELWHAIEHAAGVPYSPGKSYEESQSEARARMHAITSGLDTTVFSRKVNHPGSKQTPFTANTMRRLKEFVNNRLEALRNVR